MVVVKREEAERAPVGSEMEAEGFIEGLRGVKAANGEMDVAKASCRGKAGPLGRIEGGDGLEIERKSVHHDAIVLPPPFAARAVGVDFDAILFGVIKIERFADEMIRGTDEIPTMARGMAEKRAERRPIGKQKGEMEESSAARRTRITVRESDKGEMKVACGERSGGRRMREELQTEFAVEGDLLA